MSNLKQKRFVDTDYFHEQLDSTTVEVEGSHISATETKIGYTTDIEILGNTIQDASNLADIRSVGDKIEGQELYEIPVLSVGKNLCISRIYQDISDVAYAKVKIRKNCTYTISTSLGIGGGHISLNTEPVHTGNKQLISDFGQNKYTFTSNLSDGEYYLVFWKSGLSSSLNDTVQLEEGTQATPYEPYQEDKLTILSPVQLEKVGKIADRIIEKDGVWGVEKNVYTATADSFSQNSNKQLWYIHRSKVPNWKSKNTWNEISNRIMCNYYKEVATYNEVLVAEGIFIDHKGTNPNIIIGTNDVNVNSLPSDLIVKYQLETPTFIPLPKDQQVKLRTFANKTNISFLTEVEGYIKCKVPKSVGGTLESLVEKAKITDDRIEMLETVSEGNNMKYSTDKGVIHCKDTRKGRVNDLTIEGNTMVNYCTDGSKTLTLNGDINEVGTNITTENAVNNGKVDVMCEGNTLVNLFSGKIADLYGSGYRQENNGYITIVQKPYGDCIHLKTDMYKPNTTYTLIVDVKENTLPVESTLQVDKRTYMKSSSGVVPAKSKGLYKMVFTTIDDFSTTTENRRWGFYFQFSQENQETKGDITLRFILLEGDWTDKEIPSYFEGLSSVGQDDENGHKIEILSQNKNLLDETTIIPYNMSSIKKEDGWYVCDDGNYGGVRIGKAFLKKGVQYYLNFEYENISNGGHWCVPPIGTTNYVYLGGNVGMSLPQGIGNKSIKLGIPNEDCYVDCMVLRSSTSGTIKYRNISITTEPTTSYVKYSLNKKEILLNEPLRGLPNGVKDKIVKIGGKWYVERNCGEIVLNGSESWKDLEKNSSYLKMSLQNYPNDMKYGIYGICDKFAFRADQGNSTMTHEFISSTGDKYFSILVSISASKLSTQDATGFKQWLSENPTTVVYQLATPTYEELEVDPTLTTYVDQTHISTNSVIPCDMKVKNSGYSTIIKPSTLYTVALDTSKSGEVKVNLGGAEKTTTNNIVTITTPSTLVDDSLRISGKGLTSTNVRLLEGDKTNFIPSYFEGLKSSFDEKQGDNHIVEVVSKNKNLFNMDDIALKALDSNIVASKENDKIRIKNINNIGYGAEIIKLFLEKGTYTLSGDIEDIIGSSIGFRAYVNKSYGITSRKLTFTVDYNQEVTLLYYLGMQSSSQVESVISNIQLVKGTDLKTYVPYKSNKLQFSTLAPLRSVGDISDKLVYKDNKWMIERNCGEVILDGNKDYVGEMYKDGENYLQFNLKFDKHSLNDFVAYSDRFVNVEFTNRYNSEGFSMHRQKLIVLKILKTKLSTQDLKGLKEWLSENPTTIVYQLAEPYYEEIGEYKNLDSYDERTTIYANTLIAPKNLSFNLAAHMSNIVKDVQDDVSDLKTWRSEVFDSITHKKTFDSGFTTIEDTKEGVIDEVKLEGRTLVNKFVYSHNGTDATTKEIICKNYRDLNTGKFTVPNITNKQIGFNIYNRTTDRFIQSILVPPYSNVVVDLDKEDAYLYNIHAKQDNGWNSCDELKEIAMFIPGDLSDYPLSFFEGLKSVGDVVDEIVVSSVNENLFDGKLIDGYYADNTFNRLNEVGKIYQSFKVYLPKGEYCISFSKTVTRIRSIIDGVYSNEGGTSTKFNIKTNTDGFVGFSFRDATSATTVWDNSPITISKGTTPKPYTPHQSDKKRLLYYNEETQTWEKPILRQWDSIEKHANGKYYYHQRSGEVVFNGTSGFGGYTERTNTIRVQLGIPLANNGVVNMICDKLHFKNIYSLDEKGIYASNKVVYLSIPKSELSSLDINGVNNWLTSNNVTVVYKLAEEKVYEVFNLELNSYDGETNVIIDSGAISPVTTVSLTSNLPQVAQNLKNRVRQLEAEVYNYKVTQNLRQLRTFYKSDYANFGVATVGNTFIAPTSLEITPYGYDLFELFKEIISEGKDCYDRIELEEYIDFYVMTFIFDFEMAFELFDMIDSQHLDTEIEDEPIEDEENSEIIEDEPIDPDFSVDYEEPTIDEDIDVEMGVIPEDDLIDVEMGVIPNDDLIDIEMGVIPNEDIDVEFSVDVEEDQTKDEDLEV